METTPDGTPLHRVTIANGGAKARIMSRGASLTDFRLEGVGHALVLGSDDLDAYLGPMLYYGAIVGPVANRIANGRMTVAGTPCTLDRNENGITTLHGGGQGFGQRNWTVTQATATEVTLSLHHPNGLGGFPGNIDVTVRYALDDAGALIVEITGQSDRETVFNPAFHGYWALDGTADVGHHRMTILAERYLPVDAAMIPCGAPAPIAGTIYDYRSAATPDPALDHNFCLSDARTDMRPVLTLETDRLRLDLSTTEPGLQVYTGATIDTAPFPGHGGAPYTRNAGIAIEPQVWPDAPNHPDYPSAALLPGQTYRQVSRFAVTRKT
ncbi:aldose epimerase family protein [Sagittula sp. P11]|uniref:aldose epimerase family protein n=1 Tax=Sagittula sp. P11 TaxID=2009329 RepID=UPI0018E1E1C0|nr:aldose epimerase family protein [Sagittula sp. P11]